MRVRAPSAHWYSRHGDGDTEACPACKLLLVAGAVLAVVLTGLLPYPRGKAYLRKAETQITGDFVEFARVLGAAAGAGKR